MPRTAAEIDTEIAQIITAAAIVGATLAPVINDAQSRPVGVALANGALTELGRRLADSCFELARVRGGA